MDSRFRGGREEFLKARFAELFAGRVHRFQDSVGVKEIQSFAWLDGNLEKENQERGENEAGDPQVHVILKRLRDLKDGLDDRLAGEQPQSVEDSDDAEREQSQIAGFATEEEESQRREANSENEEAQGQLGDLRPQVRDREGQRRNRKK